MPPDSTAAPAPVRVLSGIQPTGRFHWGNYFGAIRQYIDLQAAGESFYFIADLHALTTVREPARLRALVRDAALDLVALGLDPEQAALFVQSDVPEVTELTWLLMTVTPMGLLERGSQDLMGQLGDHDWGQPDIGRRKRAYEVSAQLRCGRVAEGDSRLRG